MVRPWTIVGVLFVVIILLAFFVDIRVQYGPYVPLRDADDILCQRFDVKHMDAAAPLLQRVAVDNTIVLAEGNHAFLELTKVWLGYMRRQNVTNILFIALDDVMYTAMRQEGVAVMSPGEWFPEEAQSFRQGDYDRIVQQKFVTVKEILKQGYNVFLLDVDVICLRNPMVMMQEAIGDCDFVAATDSLVFPNGRNLTDEPCFTGDGFSTWVNTGAIFFRATFRNQIFLSSAIRIFTDAKVHGEATDDQKLANMYLDGLEPKLYPKSSCVDRCYSFGTLKFRIVDPSEVANFWLFSRSDEWLPFRDSVTCVHFNWLPTLDSKVEQIQSAGFWVSPPPPTHRCPA